MKPLELKQRLAVCSWSLQPASVQDLVAKLNQTGLTLVQLALDPLCQDPPHWSGLPGILSRSGINIVSGMFGCEGEDYTTLESIRRTGGIAPDSTWELNWKHIQAVAALARELKLSLVTSHAGFLPHDEREPAYAKMLRRLGEVADIFDRAGIAVGLETGQETAEQLRNILQKLNRKNLGANFDPANMILYGKGDPIEALDTLAGRIRQVHIKDAKRTKIPGTWGEEVAAGCGDVDWRGFFAGLTRQSFCGPIVIEREAGIQRVEDIRLARDLVTRILS